MDPVDAILEENPPIMDFKQMDTAQQQDPDILKLQTSLSSLTLKACPIPMSNGKINCLLGYLIQLFHYHTDRFLTLYSRSHILELEPVSSSSLLVLPAQHQL